MPESPSNSSSQRVPVINVLGIKKESSAKSEKKDEVKEMDSPSKNNFDFFNNLLKKREKEDDLKSMSSLKSRRDAQDILG